MQHVKAKQQATMHLGDACNARYGSASVHICPVDRGPNASCQERGAIYRPSDVVGLPY